MTRIVKNVDLICFPPALLWQGKRVFGVQIQTLQFSHKMLFYPKLSVQGAKGEKITQALYAFFLKIILGFRR